MRACIALSYIPSTLSNHHSEFDYFKDSGTILGSADIDGWTCSRVNLLTFMMRNNSLGNFELTARRKKARGGFEEKERLLWYRIIQFFRVCRIVSSNCDNLWTNKFREAGLANAWLYTFFPCLTNAAIAGYKLVFDWVCRACSQFWTSSIQVCYWVPLKWYEHERTYSFMQIDSIRFQCLLLQ